MSEGGSSEFLSAGLFSASDVDLSGWMLCPLARPDITIMLCPQCLVFQRAPAEGVLKY